MSFVHSARVRCNGAALVIVLAFLVLLSGLVVAYFIQTTSERKLASSSFEDTAAEVLARSSLDIIVSDLKQEIADAPGVTAANVQPTAFGTPASGSTPIPNLLRRSASGDPTARTSTANSGVASANGRSISAARWNNHYLMPRASTAATIDSTPVSSFTAPDWVLVTPDGPQLMTTPATTVIGRYAYMVFDEGALLDLNIAGFPFSPATPAPAATPGIPSTDVGRKGNVAFADLTGLPTSPTVITGSTVTPTSWHSASATNDIVGWRNYATVQPTGSFSNFSFDRAATSPGSGSRFTDWFLNPTRSFLTVSTTTTPTRTDQALMTRGELLKLRSASGFSQSVLQYLGTFSRELNRPTSTPLTARWPLSRFDLFATTPPTDLPAIQTNFGLRYIAAVTGPPAIGEHWEYVGTSGSARLSAIPAATAVIVNSDLPLLLKLVLPATATTGEILSIVASLIDQRDSNNDTTWIEFGAAGPAQKAYGVDINTVVDPDPSPSPPPRPATVVVLNRAFRTVGELGYAYRNASTQLDFLTATSTDAPLLDQFTFNTAPIRAGVVNLNTRNIAVITALLTGAMTTEPASIASRTNSFHTAQSIDLELERQKAVGRSDVARIAGAAGSFLGVSDEARKTVVRALAELSQTRTWNLMIDVVAQSGRYPPTATALSQFVVQGEKRYWLHIAIDRFTGEVIDQQLEAVYE
jgi:Tfp pilus assembly protein PilX